MLPGMMSLWWKARVGHSCGMMATSPRVCRLTKKICWFSLVDGPRSEGSYQNDGMLLVHQVVAGREQGTRQAAPREERVHPDKRIGNVLGEQLMQEGNWSPSVDASVSNPYGVKCRWGLERVPEDGEPAKERDEDDQ